jgi:hypothetical protein
MICALVHPGLLHRYMAAVQQLLRSCGRQRSARKGIPGRQRQQGCMPGAVRGARQLQRVRVVRRRMGWFQLQAHAWGCPERQGPVWIPLAGCRVPRQAHPVIVASTSH